MIQEKFINSYIEILTSTVTEAIQKNLVFQAQKKILEQSLEETNKLLENERNFSKKVKDEYEELIKQRDKNLFEINEHKKNSLHIETFKSELVKCRKSSEELLAQIEVLKKEKEELEKKLESFVKKPQKTKTISKNKPTEENVEDAGKF